MIKIFTIPFSKEHETFFDDDLNQFLLNKKVETIKAEFFKCREHFYWTIFVDYNPLIQEKRGKLNIKLSEPDELLFRRLKEWRKERAEKEGIPVYIVATNAQLIAVVQSKTRTKEGLKQVKGYGKKKIEKYGDDILKIVCGFLNDKRSADI